MTIHNQMPSAIYAAKAHRWLSEWKRTIKPGARPLVILQPMGPVMFVFDVSDTEPLENAPQIPAYVENPFKAKGGYIDGSLDMTIENAKRDGIRTTKAKDGSQSAGRIWAVVGSYHAWQKFRKGLDEFRRPIFDDIPVKYDLVLNSDHDYHTQFATLIHELAHLYCGHLGTPNQKWWPDRRGLPHNICEFEAESVAFMVCRRLGIENPSDQYLAGYLKQYEDTPPISLECVMKAAGLVEKMSKEPMKIRKD
jgi:hypothetical protein